MFLTTHCFKSTKRKAPSSTRLRHSCWSQFPLPRKKPCEQPMKGRKKMGRGRGRWGAMGNFRQGQTIRVVAQETLTSVCSTPHPALPHQSLFSPDRADQWPRVMVVSSFVWRYSTAHHCDGSTRPERDRKRKGRHNSAVQNLLLGGRIPRGFLSYVSAAGQRGDMVSGAWE